ncbi:hypothetical protein PP182_15930 [Maribacter sp. PR1]|uniref:DUF6702 family protein n=1 Tax=Maribacter cobaltidurans TaxID=1178778 RepID=A0ABU7IXB4_9FLAO|nr:MULTISPECIES: DUF6702 family protein [Maribacter]MDC6390183.1 hypothetical protein [Maribacter sp. PR1]MEE1977573.1 DUF6702 family protein [Maribacter cobaltidurans]
MRRFKKVWFLLLLPLVAFTVAHKFYISVTNIGYSEKDDALQITTRIFVDDMNAVLKERYGIDSKLGTKKETEMDNDYFEKYLRSKFLVEVDGKTTEYTLLGKKYETDMIICYMEVPKVNLKKVSSIAVINELLTDLFDEQQNVVHFKVNGKKKSYVLLKSDTKGMLNL